MAKVFGVCALCVVSAGLAAGIDHYAAAAIKQALTELIRGPHLQQTLGPKAAVAAPADMNVAR